MNRSAGAIALLVVLFAGARFATSPASPRSVTGSEANSEYNHKEIRPEGASCEAFADPSPGDTSSTRGEVTSLVQRYIHGVEEKTQLAPNSVPEGVQFMVATVPDPVHTHLSFQFDRTLEALQQGLQDEKYTYDSSWLPWRTHSSDYQALADQQAEGKSAVQRELCPGLILFRRNMGAPRPGHCPDRHIAGEESQSEPYACGIFVFVVAETPTAGLNQIQWLNAMDWIDKYAGKGRSDTALRILGPTFSGSMPSIVRALAGLESAKRSFTSGLLYSGRIRGCASWRWLNMQLQGSKNFPVRTSDFDENDAVQIDRFYRYLTDAGHALSEVAVISEDETAYGGLADAHTPGGHSERACEPLYARTNRPVHLYYPRDISAIRSAYQEQSIFSTGTNSDTAKSPHAVLQPQYEPGASHQTDSIEPFSGQGMALTQEAQLYGIVNELKTHGIRFVILRSTNSLDYLFLARFLHRAYPDAFIVTMGTDILFGREIDSTEFRGVVALSAFPLLPRGQDWTLQSADLPQHAHRIFGSDIMEGVYLAARFLTTDDAVKPGDPDPFLHPPKPDIPDYAAPFWEKGPAQGAASTWLSVIGRDGYWPVAVLKEPYLGRLPDSNLSLVMRPAGVIGTRSETPPGWFTLSGGWKFFCFIAVLLMSVHFIAWHSAWKHQHLAVFIHFTPMPGDRQPMLMTLGWATVCSLLLLLFLASARIYPWLHFVDQMWVWIVAVFAVAGFAAFIGGLRPVAMQKTNDSTPDSPIPRTHRVLWIAVMLALIAASGFAGLKIFDYASSNGVPTAYRAVHLTSGISPMVSLLLMLGGYYWWFWQALSGLALLGAGRPILPQPDSLPTGLTRVSSEMAAMIEEPAMPFPSCRGQNIWFYLLPLLVLALQICVLQRPWTEGFDSIFHSLENKAFSWTLHAMFGIGLYMLGMECGQLLMTWSSLKRLLLALNRLPLRRTFAALQGLSMHSLWSMSGTSSRARYTIFSHQVESLVHLHNELETPEAAAYGTPEVRSEVHMTLVQGVNFVERHGTGADFAMLNDDRAQAIRQSTAQCAGMLMKHLLLPAWFAERKSLDLADTTEAQKQKEQLPLSEIAVVQLAEEFVSLVYVAYLQNMLARMRTMVLSMGGMFAAIALSVAFYPYTPHPLLVLSLLFLLMLLGMVVSFVYAGLDRDSTLSHITNTEPGTLGINFWIRIASFVGVPALGMLVAQFPEFTDFVVSWIQPSVSSMK